MNKIFKNLMYVFILVIGLIVMVACNGEGIELSLGVSTEFNIDIDESINLEARVIGVQDAVINYSSSDDQIVSIDGDGNLKGLDFGEVRIDITVEGYPNLKKQITVRVNEGELVLTGKTEITVGEVTLLSALDEKGGDNLVWESNDPEIARIEQDGKLTGVSVGEVEITISSLYTENTKTLKIKVVPSQPEVKEPTELLLGVDPEINLEIGQQLNLEATTDEEAEINYSSSNNKVVSVDKAGNIKALDFGEAMIEVVVKGYPNLKKQVQVIVNKDELTLSGKTTIRVSEVAEFTGKDEKGGDNFGWASSNSRIATVDEDGNVTGVSVGEVEIMIISLYTGEIKSMAINVLSPEPKEIDIVNTKSGRILLLDEFRLIHEVLPKSAKQDVNWSSSDETIAVVNSDGVVKTYRSGKVIISARSTENQDVLGIYEINVEVDPIELLKKFNVENPVHKKAASNFFPEMEDLIYGSVNLYWPGDMNLKVEYIQIMANDYVGEVATPEIIDEIELKTVRSGVLKPEIKNIIYHDTGNANIGATARMHANYIAGVTQRYRSWHYTVDDLEIIQHIPDDEVAFHGDSYEAYTTTIGIETAINKESDFFLTWHRTAKLISMLMAKYDLGMDNIKQHFDYSLKDCPQVLRKTGLWDTALDLVYAEYLVQEELAGYEIEYISNNPEYITNEGRVIRLESTPVFVSYDVRITNNNGYAETITLNSMLPAKLR